MSTFGGYMPEFPDIRVDYFRQIPGRTSPLACFLSHVHSDHLVGLDNDRVKLPFVYCSAATKEILVRLERRRDRLNLAQGILEKEKRTYKHLKNVLKPIPLETPTLIELAPKNEVRVTLFDANHCTGAVMFLFERENTAVLYTGDIRSEPWFVNNLIRNPFLIEYTSGMKTLDCIYLDTSNIGPMEFPTKAEGLKELIGKVKKYPPNTKFHFAAWTFGYEEVWAALSRTLDSQIHVDKYKIKLYESLRQEGSNGQLRFLASEGPVLAGCVVGNSPKQGCLTIDKSVRIHSCEKGMGCSLYGEEDVVLIRPIISRLPSGVEVEEIGIGGGWGDLVPRHEIAMDFDDVKELLETVFAETDEPIVEDIRRMLLAELSSTAGAISLDGISSVDDQISLKDLGESLLRKFAHKSSEVLDEKNLPTSRDDLLKVITFPYSRHSSYPELCHLVEIFKPKDVYPCTVDEENWHEGVSMKELFGDHCSASVSRHDNEMRHMMAIIVAELDMPSQQTQTTVESKSSPMQNGYFEELTLTAASWENKSRPSTPIPSQESLAGTIGKPWSEEIVTSSPAPPSQIGADSISQTPGSIATKSGSSSSSQISRRRTATEIISPPPLKRVRLSQDSQVDGPTSSKSPTPSTSAAVSKQRSLNPVDEPIKDSVDLELPLTTLMKKLDTVPTLCENAMKALMTLQNGDLEIETYIAQELPNLKSINTQIDQLVPPSVLSVLHMTMLSFSQETLNILSEFQGSFEGNSGVHIDVNTYFCRQFSPLQYLTQEFKQVTSYLTQPPSQQKPWDSTKSLDSMSKIFQPKANNDGDMIGHRDIFTLADDNELATDDDIEGGNDHHSQPHGSSLVAAGGNHCDSENRPFHDPIDNITRCGDCGHEIWEDQAERFEWMPGFCTGCGIGPNPFYENIDFPGALPRIFEEEDYGSEVSSQEARVLIGNTHLDYQSSAYDTQDEDSQLVLNEEYEINSFIDDEPDSDSESHTSDHGSEVDYKAAFQNLQKDFTELRNDYFALVDEYSQFKYDMLGTTEEEEDYGDEEEEEGILINEDGVHVVDVVVAQGDHVVTDVVVSSFRGGENEKSGGDEDVGMGMGMDEREKKGEGEGVDGGGGDDESAGENLDGASTVARSHTLSNLRVESVEL